MIARPDGWHRVHLDARQMATVRAALLHWQAARYPSAPTVAEADRLDALHDIASGGGRLCPLSMGELATLIVHQFNANKGEAANG